MKNWRYKAQNNPQEVISKLQSVFLKNSGFLFDYDKISASFKIRKPVKYPDQILHRNRIVVKGTVSNAGDNNETDLDISFAQDFYMKMTVFSIIMFGSILIVLISKGTSGSTMYLLESAVLLTGSVLWLALQKKLNSDVQKYKALITKILGSS